MDREGLSSGAHLPVLLHEAVAALAIRPDGVYVDGTFGRGGHSRHILQALGPKGRLLALDRDPEAVAAARAWKQESGDARFEIVHARFSSLDEVLDAHGLTHIDAAGRRSPPGLQFHRRWSAGHAHGSDRGPVSA